MKKLGIDPMSIEEVFISHTHFDHIGGLSAFLNVNNNVTVYLPVLLRGIRDEKQVVYVQEPTALHENIFSTGELDNIEQSMAIKTHEGMVLIVGCSHPKMEDILNNISRFGKVCAVIGGLHGFREYELFQDMVLICPTHCTQHIPEIKSRFPEKYVEGGVGRIISDKQLGT